MGGRGEPRFSSARTARSAPWGFCAASRLLVCDASIQAEVLGRGDEKLPQRPPRWRGTLPQLPSPPSAPIPHFVGHWHFSATR